MSSSRLSNDALGNLARQRPGRHGLRTLLVQAVKPLILVGFFLMLVSLTGFIEACCCVHGLLWVHLVFMFLLIFAGFVFTIFAFVVTNKGVGRMLSRKRYKEYRLGGYSNWLQKRVNNDGNWNKIKSCLDESKICNDFSYRFRNDTLEKFQKESLNALQSGCCMPSNECGFTYRYPTYWIEENGVYKHPDCRAWDNDQNVLRFNCQLCKAGVLDNIQNSWKRVSRLNVLCLILPIIV